jgi:WD40 repeat protein
MADQTQTGGVNFGRDNTITVSGDVVGTQVVGYSAEQVTALIGQLGASYQPKPFDGRCPYVGLAAFDERDADRFFGRERLVAELASRVASRRCVVVAGPSGSGKSSLVRAGLIPALRKGSLLPGSERWLCESLRPGRNPLDELARVASSLAGSLAAGDDIRARGRADPAILHRWVDIALKDDRARRAVILVDQFEEVFTQVADEAERLAFLNLLVHAATAEGGRVILLLTLRSDFISDCAAYPQLNALLNQSFIQVGAMQPDELVSAIALPALQVGLRIDPDLVAQIVNDMRDEPGALPLMQFALRDLFEAQQAAGGVVALTLSGYLSRGGIRQSLQRYADAQFAQLSGQEQELARAVFTNLIQLGAQPTRRTARFDELAPSGADAAAVQSIVRRLADARLLTTGQQDQQDTIAIAHERLIDAWPWLRQLVHDNREVIALQSEVADAAARWETSRRDPSYLYAGARLAAAQEQLAAKRLKLSGPAQAFVEASVRARDAARIRRQRVTISLLAGLTAVALIFAGLAAWAVGQSNEARRQEALSRSRELAAVAINQLADFPERALLIALQINTDPSLPRTPQSEDALRQAFLAWPGRAVLAGHTDAVESAAFSPDGKFVVTASDDGAARVWDAATRQTLATLTGHAGWVTRAAFSPDGARIVTAGDDGTARLWDARTGSPLIVLSGHAGPVTSAEFSPDGTLVITGGQDGTVRLWDATSGREDEARRLKSAGAVRDASFSPDGAYALVADANNLVRAWDVSNLGDRSAPALSLTVTEVTAARFSPDGLRIVTADRSGLARIWSAIDPAQPPVALRGHTLWIYRAQFSPDGLRVVTASQDQTARLWDAATGTQEASLVGHANFVVDAQFSPDGRFVVTAGNDRAARLWDAGRGRAEDDWRGHGAEVFAARYSPDGRRAVTAGGDGAARVWDAETGRTLFEVAHDGLVLDAQFSPDGSRFATSGSDGAARVWDAATGAPVAALVHAGPVWSAAFSPDGKRVATASGDGTARVWDAATGAEMAALRSHTDGVTLARFSPDGKRVVTASRDGTARVWDFGAGTEVVLRGHDGAVTSAAFSPDGALVATGGQDASARVWDAASGAQKFTLAGHSRPVNDVVFSPDGKLILTASVDQTARLWDAASGKPGPTLGGHLREVYRARFSPDGQLVATASGDGTSHLYDVVTGRELAILRGHRGAVYSIEFSPDGRQVLTAGQDGSARRDWVALDQVIALARERVTRQPPELLCDERQQVLGDAAACPVATPAPTPKP